MSSSVFAKSAGSLLPEVTSARSFSRQTKIERSAETPFAQIRRWRE